MAQYDLIIRGGSVVDGTGIPARTADVAISDGVIVEVGAVDGSAERTIDADGALVIPGIVDIHTHYDGQATWDRRLQPSSWHGVTTVVTGNCGVGFAPVISILRQLRAESYADPVTLVYGNRVETQILYREELEAMAREIPLELRFVLAEPPPGWRGAVGQLTPDVLAGLLDAPRRAHWQYFVCGPPPMMNSVEHGLRALGVPARQIVAEHFQYA